jgi:hypothetical protein
LKSKSRSFGIVVFLPESRQLGLGFWYFTCIDVVGSLEPSAGIRRGKR